MMTQNVKQVQVGKHSFPLYSHPAIRETAGTEAYVERVVQKHQNSPRVRNSVNYVARKLRQIGAMKTLNPEEHQVGEETSCAKSARTDRKHSYSPSPFEGRIPAALKSAKRNSEVCKTPMGKLQAPCSPTVCGYPLPYPRSLSHNLFNVIQDTRRKGKTNTEQSELKNEGDPLTLSPIVPKVDTSPATESKGRRREEKPLAHEGQLLKHKLDVWRDLFLASAAQQLAASGHPRSRRDDAGNVFYSNISCYLKEGCIVKSEDTDLRTGPRDHLRVQGAYLSHLAPEAFANLHVTLDGNTFVLRNVQRTSPTIKQISEELCEERGIRLLPTAMQKKVAYLVSQVSTSTKERAGTISGKKGLATSKWKHTNSLQTCKHSLNMELPEVTYRSRVLSTIREGAYGSPFQKGCKM
ncbi:uncharacterized protein TEOVI_000486500 [Trypanosoma equiperdum]|uniref:Uncharacterized protein n=2 Tax=Trypanozoon TaxID=39700 RepID=Q385K2_TRYB2|nr:hypothetical protein, conserved [Trypanosoma brucei brucei TREU927]EAN79529.1 hypothetical protein, conserved [Trypanosoma brucei brucei TREU927]SCU66345.1 hypothetical protein, conserved [Trypanosoma equiperdum]